MSYLTIVKVEGNKMAVYQDFESKSDADAHKDKHGGFVVEKPAGDMDYWTVDAGAKTITYDSSTETTDKAAYDAKEYQRKRVEEYPSIDELTVALFEGVVEERMAAVTSLEGKRQAVKAKYPK